MALTAKRARVGSLPEDRSWFEALFKAHWSSVHGLLFKLVGEHAEAEDLALEAFWRLYQHGSRLENGGARSAWLYRVATNLGLNALRGRKRRQHYENQAGHWTIEENVPPDPPTELERKEQSKRIREVLAQMKPRAARLLILRHSGLSYNEVAAALGIAPGSVGTLLARAEREFEAKYRKVESR